MTAVATLTSPAAAATPAPGVAAGNGSAAGFADTLQALLSSFAPGTGAAPAAADQAEAREPAEDAGPAAADPSLFALAAQQPPVPTAQPAPAATPAAAAETVTPVVLAPAPAVEPAPAAPAAPGTAPAAGAVQNVAAPYRAPKTDGQALPVPAKPDTPAVAGQAPDTGTPAAPDQASAVPGALLPQTRQGFPRPSGEPAVPPAQPAAAVPVGTAAPAPRAGTAPVPELPPLQAATASPAAGSPVPAAPAGPAPLPAPSAPAAVPAPAVPVPAGYSAQLARPLFSLATAGTGEHTMTVQIEPERLGPVTVQAHIGSGGVRIEMFAASADGRDVLRQALPELRKDLAGAGISASLDLSSNAQSGSPQGGQDRETFTRRFTASNQGPTTGRPLEVKDQNTRTRPGLYGPDTLLDVMA